MDFLLLFFPLPRQSHCKDPVCKVISQVFFMAFRSSSDSAPIIPTASQFEQRSSTWSAKTSTSISIFPHWQESLLPQLVYAGHYKFHTWPPVLKVIRESEILYHFSSERSCLAIHFLTCCRGPIKPIPDLFPHRINAGLQRTKVFKKIAIKVPRLTH